jgi:hypothetical protein
MSFFVIMIIVIIVITILGMGVISQVGTVK